MRLGWDCGGATFDTLVWIISPNLNNVFWVECNHVIRANQIGVLRVIIQAPQHATIAIFEILDPHVFSPKRLTIGHMRILIHKDQFHQFTLFDAKPVFISRHGMTQVAVFLPFIELDELEMKTVFFGRRVWI
mgnify:CR=1 FL=1